MKGVSTKMRYWDASCKPANIYLMLALQREYVTFAFVMMVHHRKHKSMHIHEEETEMGALSLWKKAECVLIITIIIIISSHWQWTIVHCVQNKTLFMKALCKTQYELFTKESKSSTLLIYSISGNWVNIVSTHTFLIVCPLWSDKEVLHF